MIRDLGAGGGIYAELAAGQVLVLEEGTIASNFVDPDGGSGTYRGGEVYVEGDCIPRRRTMLADRVSGRFRRTEHGPVPIGSIETGPETRTVAGSPATAGR